MVEVDKNICQSCKEQVGHDEITRINDQIDSKIIDYEDLIICEVCYPWVSYTFRVSPQKVLGYEIKNIQMFLEQRQSIENRINRDTNSEHWKIKLTHIPRTNEEWLDF